MTNAIKNKAVPRYAKKLVSGSGKKYRQIIPISMTNRIRK
jgi:hypothetical protein